jgi:hypothetical protein
MNAVRRPADAQKFYIDFLPGESRLIRRDGIQMFGIHYWDSALSPVAGRSTEKYLVRYDPRDLSHVYVKDRELHQYLKVPYRDIRNPPITQSEHRSVMKRLGKNKSWAINEANIFAAILDQRGARRKSAKRDHDRSSRSREGKLCAALQHPRRCATVPVIGDRSEEARIEAGAADRSSLGVGRRRFHQKVKMLPQCFDRAVKRFHRPVGA